MTANGYYYAWARDNVGLASSERFFNITGIDRLPPTIAAVAFSANNSVVVISARDYESGVKCIYIDGTAYAGSTVS